MICTEFDQLDRWTLRPVTVQQIVSQDLWAAVWSYFHLTLVKWQVLQLHLSSPPSNHLNRLGWENQNFDLTSLKAWKGCGLTVNVGMKLGDFPSSEIQTAWTVMCFLICFDNIHFSESWHLGAVPYYLIGFRNDFISQENVIKTANWFVRLICSERHDGFLTTGRERVAGLHTSFKQVLRFFSLFLPFQNVEHILVCAGST